MTKITQTQRHVPKVNHLDILHALENPYERARGLDPRADERQLPQTRQPSERSCIFHKIIVKIEHTKVGRNLSQQRESSETARCDLEVD